MAVSTIEYCSAHTLILRLSDRDGGTSVDYTRSQERKKLLMALGVLFVEEFSLTSAEQWSSMWIVLQELKQSPFHSVAFYRLQAMIKCNCHQSKATISSSTVLLTNFAISFLGNFVRMTDEAGQTVFQRMWRRLIDAHAEGMQRHTNQFFKLELQNITIGKYNPHQLTSTESVLKTDSVDSDVHVSRF